MPKKEPTNKYVIAVGNMETFLNDLESGNIRMPGKADTYKEIFASAYMKLNNLKELGKFIRKIGLSKKECKLYWESLVEDKYTLMAVEYNKGDISLLCDGKNVKFLAEAKK